MASNELQKLAATLTALAPSFGRAQSDIEAIRLRAEGGDHKGVLQGARLILETLLRSLCADVLKEEPAKRMLDELLQRFNQQDARHLIPPTISMHMRTLQTWGNLGAHDQATSLQREGTRIGPEEALTSLNSLVAVLTWYRDSFASARADDSARSAADERGSAAARGTTRRPMLLGVGAVVAVAGLGLGVWATLLRGEPPADQATCEGIARLLAADKEPAPPAECAPPGQASAVTLLRAAEQLRGGRASGARPQDKDALAMLTPLAASEQSALYWYLLARARLFSGAPAGEASEAAARATAACPAFAAAHNLAGTSRLAAGKADEARTAYAESVRLAPDYMAPRFNLALILLAAKEAAPAATNLEAVLAREPDNAAALLLAGKAYLSLGRAADAKTAFCRAGELGLSEAARLCNE